MSTVQPLRVLKIPCDFYHVESTTEGDVLEGDDIEDTWFYPYGTGEVVWGILLAGGIFGVNLWVLWVVGGSRDLWKPRHLWMACLCVTDLFIGVHKVIELLLLILPPSMKQLCIINKATLGIPYILNMLLLTLLSLDRYVAVAYPFVYSAVASNKHVGIGFLLVLIIGGILSWASISNGLQDVVCRVHFLQLKYLIVTLTLCSILTLVFNVRVLRIAKRQLTAIYTSGATSCKPRPLLCSNCGHPTPATVTAMTSVPDIPLGSTDSDHVITKVTDDQMAILHSEKLQNLPLFKDMQNLPLFENLQNLPLFENLQNLPLFENMQNLAYEGTSAEEMTQPTIIRTSSLPEMMPISSAANLEIALETSLEKGLEETTGSLGDGTDALQPPPRRCRSLFSFSSLRGHHSVHVPSTTRHHFFRHLHFSRTHVFHVGRLFPSIRFARTVLLIMIPMWIFILPVIIIIPLHRSCEVGTRHVGCPIVDTLWTYLLVHIRSVLLLQAILDTLIYACRSKEFRNAIRRAYKKQKTTKSPSKA